MRDDIAARTTTTRAGVKKEGESRALCPEATRTKVGGLSSYGTGEEARSSSYVVCSDRDQTARNAKGDRVCRAALYRRCRARSDHTIHRKTAAEAGQPTGGGGSAVSRRRWKQRVRGLPPSAVFTVLSGYARLGRSWLWHFAGGRCRLSDTVVVRRSR